MWQEVLIVSHEYFISCDRCQISWNVFFCDRFPNRNFHFVTGIFSLWQEISVSDQFCSSYKRKFILMTRICFLYRRSIFILNYCLWYVSTQYDRKCLPVIENLSSFDVQFCRILWEQIFACIRIYSFTERTFVFYQNSYNVSWFFLWGLKISSCQDALQNPTQVFAPKEDFLTLSHYNYVPLFIAWYFLILFCTLKNHPYIVIKSWICLCVGLILLSKHLTCWDASYGK